LKKAHLHEVYPVGTIVTVNRPCMDNPAGSKALVYENYRLGKNHRGASLLFANGDYDGFSEEDMGIFEVNPVGFCESCAGYRVESCSRLEQDLLTGRFSAAFS